MSVSQKSLLAKLQEHTTRFHPVVPFDPEQDAVLRMDFTAANKKVSEDILLNTDAFSRYVNNLLHAHHCRYGIGGYNEHRAIYSRSNVFDAGDSNEEPRRLHLGIDIWGKAGTPVFAPLNGNVHSFAFNDRFGDYGATIILQHQLHGEPFYILYGHLSLADLTNLTAGNYISAGETVGHFGEPFENGGWPPHLHIQLIEDIQSYAGDYPGVCRYSEREEYLKNCPDPDLILGMMSLAHG